MADKLRVIEVSVKGLFGLYDHSIPLNQRDRVTIIHGPNGVGKTILLKCLVALFSGRYSILRATPFSSFIVKLSEDNEITLRREESIRESDGKKLVSLVAEVKTAKQRSPKIELKPSADVTEVARRIERETPWLVPVGEGSYMDERYGRAISAEEVIERYLDSSSSPRFAKLREAEPEALRQLRARVKIRFIETNRLYKVSDDANAFDRYGRGSAQLAHTVNEYAKQLHGQIDAALAQYGRKSQQLDQSFPQRLIQDDVAPLSLEQLKTRLEALENRHKQLSEIGLLDAIPARPFDTRSLDNLSDQKLIPMTMYLRDSEEKIAVFDGLAGRARLLLESANRKFRNKRLVINKESGLIAVDLRGQPVSLESLSSGEQHEIVLLYELLFSTSRDTLVLIDEPELSLHVTWQKMFLPELLSVCSQVGFDIIIATHSPFVVGGRRDLMVALDAEPDDDVEIERVVGAE